MILLFLLVLLFLLKSCNREMRSGASSAIATENLEIADGKTWTGNLPERYQENQDGMQEYIEIAGYADLFVTENHQTIELINMTDNTVYQQYRIFLDGEQLFDSKLIPPGKQVEWNAYQALDTGKYKLSFEIHTYDIESQQPCNGVNQTVALEVKKK